MSPCDHCWHEFTSQIVRENMNVHGPFCVTHPDVKHKHDHNFLVHKKKCCLCGNVKTVYYERLDTGERA
jgi:predicted small secreted protein